MCNKIICIYVLFMLFNFSFAAEKGNNNYPIKKEVLVNDGKILLKLDASRMQSLPLLLNPVTLIKALRLF